MPTVQTAARGFVWQCGRHVAASGVSLARSRGSDQLWDRHSCLSSGGGTPPREFRKRSRRTRPIDRQECLSHECRPTAWVMLMLGSAHARHGGAGFARGVAEVRVDVLGHDERAPHQLPVAGVGADVFVDAFRRRRRQLQRLALAGLEQLGGAEDVLGLRARTRGPACRAGRASSSSRRSPIFGASRASRRRGCAA